MNYKGKGLGLHEQGVRETIYICANQEFYGIGYQSPNDQYKCISDTSTIFEETSSDIEIGSSHRFYDDLVTTNIFNNTVILTINLDLQCPKLIDWDQQDHIAMDSFQNDEAILEFMGF